MRFSDREKQAEADRAKNKAQKATVKAQARPIAPTVQESSDEKVQAAPMGEGSDVEHAG